MMADNPTTGQTNLLDTLYGTEWTLITARLELTNGRFLQPTGFPDIGACIYRDKEGKRWCLVESEQSMANRLEAVCMKDPGVWVDDLKGLPVMAVRDPNGALLTTNLCEPHRVASSYVLEGKTDSGKTLKDIFEEKLGLVDGGNSWPMGKRGELEKLVFALDPGALLHGFQFVQWTFVGLRQTRLLHARLEAELADEPEVHYGMVKWDAIEPKATRQERANKGQSIAAKSRIVPREITASFEIDVLGLRSLALDETQKKFLLGLGLWKIGAFLGNKPAFDPRSRQSLPSLRLRADCYLRCTSVSWQADSGGGGIETTPDELMKALPEKPDFQKLVADALPVKKVEKAGQLYDGPVVEVTYKSKPKSEQKGAAATSETEGSEGETGEEEDEEA